MKLFILIGHHFIFMFICSVFWCHNGKDMRTSDDIKMDRSSTHATITVKDVKLLDGGEYTITASNHYGNKSTSCKVQILGKLITIYQV